MDLPSPDTSMKRALRYLGQHRMTEAAKLLRRCELKLDPAADGRGEGAGLEVRLRCEDETFHELKAWDEGARRWRHKAPMEQVDRAFKAVIKNAQTVDAEWVAKGEATWLIRAKRKRPVKRPRKPKEGEQKAKATKPVVKAVDGERIVIGRFAYVPGFHRVWADDEEFNLSRRLKVRLSLQLFVEREAFDEQSALSFKAEIDPYVRQQGGMPPVRPGAEIRIHHYFNPKGSSYDRLRCLLIRHCGRNGRYYLQVR